MTSTQVTEFEALRPHLMSVAYRLTGTVADAEDIVQEAWLRWNSAGASGAIADLRAWPEDAVRNEAEINGIVAVSVRQRRPDYQPAVKNPPHGDAKNGEQIVKEIGCQGCHVVGEGSRDEAGPRRTFGQPLENIGNKTTYEWIFNWVRDPKHYSPATYMPNLRLTDAQVGRRRDLSRQPEGAGRRRGEGNARREGRPTTCCSTT